MTNMDVNLIYIGDCIEIMKQCIPDKSVDLVFADPPYNLTLRKELYRPEGGLYDGVTEEWDKFISRQEYVKFTYRWLTEVKRILKNTGSVWVSGTYHSIYTVGYVMMDLEYFILNDVIWVKSNPTPNFAGVRFCAAHETLIWATTKEGNKYTFNYQDMKAQNGGKQMRSDWYGIPVCSGKERLKIEGKKAHSSQKPEKLLERVILSSSKEGDIILDPFFGTGTTGVVANRLGRNWIGIDSNETYCDLAINRIQNEVE